MSQFDFPRIHFSGKSIIDPATGNNNYYYPLVTYEPITGTAVLPPRIYLDIDDNALQIKHIRNNLLEHIRVDEHGKEFIEISCINSPDLFKTWNTTPLGKHKVDLNFHALYKLILTKNESRPLSGSCPGFWNYYGTMNFAFENVTIHSIQLQKEFRIKTFSQESEISDDMSILLGSKLSFNDKNGRNSAVMIDVSPTVSIYTQVFCDRMYLEKNGKIIMDGRPTKGSIRQMNPRRIVNDMSITGASGTFCTTISIEQLEGGMQSPIIQFFMDHALNRKESIGGIFIRYDLYEVHEDQAPDYMSIGEASNPAQSSVVGCIAPWYEGEMETASPGRLLLPVSEFIENAKLGPLITYYNPRSKILSLDGVGSFPEVKDKTGSKFSLYDLGTLSVSIVGKEGEVDISDFNIGPSGLDKDTLLKLGGIIDISLNGKDNVIRELDQGGELRLYGLKEKKFKQESGSLLLLKESKYRIISDQAGLYAEEGDSSANGYLSNKAKRENCIIRVFKNGIPMQEGLDISVLKLNITPFGSSENLTILDEMSQIFDGQEFQPDTSRAANLFYAFVPFDNIIPTNVKHYMLLTGAFINVRVVPAYNFGKYSNPAHPEYVETLDFEQIYQEFLIHYDLIYPASGIITPFRAGHFKKIIKYLQQIMTLDNWDRYLYMPSSRDLPNGKRKLLFRWLNEQIKDQDKKSS